MGLVQLAIQLQPSLHRTSVSQNATSYTWICWICINSYGGSLRRMLPILRLGLGGTMGDGKHYVSWITSSDSVLGILSALKNNKLSGSVKMSSPSDLANQ